jgi:hypothetical protein
LGGAASASYRAPVFGGSTWNCANGIYAGYCGTQKSNSGLYIAVGFGGQIIGTSHPLAEDAEFFWFADGSGSAANNDKYAVFAPDGIASNKVMADVNHHIVLATASGNADQKWVFNGNVPGWWTNVGTGDVLKATFDGGPIITVRSESSISSELWTFVTPS